MCFQSAFAMDLPKCLSISLLTPEGPAALPFGRLLITNCHSSRVGGDIRVEYHSSLIPLRGTSRNNPIRPIFKLPKGGRKLVECLPIIIKKIGKFGIAEFYISPATCQKFDIND